MKHINSILPKVLKNIEKGKEEKEVINKKLEETYQTIKEIQLLNCRSGGNENYNQFKKIIEPLNDFVLMYENRKGVK